MPFASRSTVTAITLDQTINIGGTLEPCHFISFGSDFAQAYLPGDDTGIPTMRIFAPQAANTSSRILRNGKEPQVYQVNKTGAIVNGLPAYSIATTKWNNSPSPDLAIGDELIFVGNTNLVPQDPEVIDGATNAQISSTIINYRDFTTANDYDTWKTLQDANASIANLQTTVNDQVDDLEATLALEKIVSINVTGVSLASIDFLDVLDGVDFAVLYISKLRLNTVAFTSNSILLRFQKAADTTFTTASQYQYDNKIPNGTASWTGASVTAINNIRMGAFGGFNPTTASSGHQSGTIYFTNDNSASAHGTLIGEGRRYSQFIGTWDTAHASSIKGFQILELSGRTITEAKMSLYRVRD